MEQDDVIERSESEWALPIVLVPKKDGSLRMCVDYRRLNSVAEADAYPMPRVDDLIDSLGKAKYITTLDLACGYCTEGVTSIHRLYDAIWAIPIAIRITRGPRNISTHDGQRLARMLRLRSCLSR